MTRILCRVLMMTLTMAIGLTVVWLMERSERSAEREVKDLSVTLTSPTFVSEESEDPQYTKILNSLRVGEFYATGHGCGNGSVTGYVTIGRQHLSHSYEAYESVAEARSAFNRELGLATVIVEGPDTVKRYGKSATRFFLKREEDGETFYEIIWLERHDMGYTAIVGPDEDNSRRLEKYVLEPPLNNK